MNKHGKRLITLAALATTTTAIIHIANKVVAASAGLKEMLDTNGKIITIGVLVISIIQEKAKEARSF